MKCYEIGCDETGTEMKRIVICHAKLVSETKEFFLSEPIRVGEISVSSTSSGTSQCSYSIRFGHRDLECFDGCSCIFNICIERRDRNFIR